MRIHTGEKPYVRREWKGLYPTCKFCSGIIGSTLEKSPMSAKECEKAFAQFCLNSTCENSHWRETLWMWWMGRPSATVPILHSPSKDSHQSLEDGGRPCASLLTLGNLGEPIQVKYLSFEYNYSGSLLAREISYLKCQKRNNDYHLFESFLWQVIWRVILEIDTGYSFTLHLRIHKGNSVVVMHLGKMSATVLPMFITNPSRAFREM